jgi:hypothetical protein
MDLNSRTIHGRNSSALEVACPAPGIGAKKVQGTSETRFCTTYSASAVGVEGRIMDDKGSILNGDGPSNLEVQLHVPRPDIEQV